MYNLHSSDSMGATLCDGQKVIMVVKLPLPGGEVVGIDNKQIDGIFCTTIQKRQDLHMTYEEVARAVIALRQEGVKPTVESIRNKLGGGSNRDITRLFRQWKSEQQEALDTEGIGIPENIVSAILEFVERVKNNAANKLQRENASLKEQVKTLTDALQGKEKEEKKHISQLVAARDQVVVADAKTEAYEKRIRKLEDELAASRARNLELVQKFAEQGEKVRAAEETWHENVALKRENKSLLERAIKAEAQLAFAERQIAQERDLRLPLLRVARDADEA